MQSIDWRLLTAGRRTCRQLTGQAVLGKTGHGDDSRKSAHKAMPSSHLRPENLKEEGPRRVCEISATLQSKIRKNNRHSPGPGLKWTVRLLAASPTRWLTWNYCRT